MIHGRSAPSCHRRMPSPRVRPRAAGARSPVWWRTFRQNTRSSLHDCRSSVRRPGARRNCPTPGATPPPPVRTRSRTRAAATGTTGPRPRSMRRSAPGTRPPGGARCAGRRPHKRTHRRRIRANGRRAPKRTRAREFHCEAARIVLVAGGVDERRQAAVAARWVVLEDERGHRRDPLVREPRERRVGPTGGHFGVVVEHLDHRRGRDRDTGVGRLAEPAGLRSPHHLHPGERFRRATRTRREPSSTTITSVAGGCTAPRSRGTGAADRAGSGRGLRWKRVKDMKHFTTNAQSTHQGPQS